MDVKDVPGLVEDMIRNHMDFDGLYRKRIVNTSSKVINKVVAAVLVKVGDKPLDVVSIGTGTKWIKIEEVYDKGKVPDGHAESVAIKGSRLYLEKQIDLCSKDTETDIFKLAAHGKYQLNDGVQFYLYISSAPCGAYREFRCQSKVPQIYTFRAKTHGAVVPQPMNPDPKKRKFEIMCCSNKIDLYCVLGFQGRRLCGVLDKPIYFSKILIGYNPEVGKSSFEAVKLHIGNLKRPIINPDLPYDPETLIYKEYHDKLPEIQVVRLPASSTSPIEDNRKRNIIFKLKAKDISLNWNKGSNKAEIIITKSGKAYNEIAQEVSQLGESDEELSYSTENTISYDDCKNAILQYHSKLYVDPPNQDIEHNAEYLGSNELENDTITKRLDENISCKLAENITHPFDMDDSTNSSAKDIGGYDSVYHTEHSFSKEG